MLLWTTFDTSRKATEARSEVLQVVIVKYLWYHDLRCITAYKTCHDLMQKCITNRHKSPVNKNHFKMQTIHWASLTEATNIRIFPTAEISAASSLTLLKMFVSYNRTVLYLKFYQKWSQNKQIHIANNLVIALSRSGQWLDMISKAFSNLDYSNCTHINKWQPFTTMAATGE